MRGQLNFKPGTIILFFFIAIAGYAIYTLVSGNMYDIGESASEDRDSVLKCSELDIEFLDVGESGENISIFFRSNRDLSGVEIGFKESNTTRLVEDVEAGEMYNATLNVSSYSNIFIETDECPKAYWWQ